MPPAPRPEVVAEEILALVKGQYREPLDAGEVRDLFTAVVQALIPYTNAGIAYNGGVRIGPPRPMQMYAVLGYFMHWEEAGPANPGG